MTKKYNEIEVKDNMKVTVEAEVEAPKEKKEFKQIVATQPTKVKKSLMGRLVSGIVGPDGIPSIGTYVNEEIIKPAIKNIIVDAVTSGINMIMYGEKGGPVRGRHGSVSRPGGHRPITNYNTISRNDHAPSERLVARPIGRQGVDDYKIVDRQDASEILVALTEAADMYDSVSVADYYDMIGVESKFTDNNYGWTIDSITRATIVPVRGGYIIKFPPVEVI